MNISQLKLGNKRLIFPSFQNPTCCEKYFEDKKTDNSLHLARKYARIFVLGHCLFLKAHSFPRGMLSKNCSLPRTGNVCGQMSEHISVRNGGYWMAITLFTMPFSKTLSERKRKIFVIQHRHWIRKLLTIFNVLFSIGVEPVWGRCRVGVQPM